MTSSSSTFSSSVVFKHAPSTSLSALNEKCSKLDADSFYAIYVNNKGRQIGNYRYFLRQAVFIVKTIMISIMYLTTILQLLRMCVGE